MAHESCWLSIIAGHTYTSWAWFEGYDLKEAWATELLSDGHLTVENVFGLPAKMLPDQLREMLQKKSSDEIEDFEPLVYIASDDTVQLEMWVQRLPRAKLVTLPDLLLKGTQRNLETHLALCLRAAASKWGWPVLVIDAGVNITYSACDETGSFVGGAILPGMMGMLQLMNSQGVRAPADLPASLPPRWATNADDPVQSGVIHTILAGIAGYASSFSKAHHEGKVVFTGEDGLLLSQWFRDQYKLVTEDLGNRLLVHSNLAHLGVRWKFIQDTSAQDEDGGPGYIGCAVSKQFDSKFYKGVVKEYLPALDTDSGEAYWGIEYQDGDVEEVDHEELLVLLENARQKKDKRTRLAAESARDDNRAKRRSNHEVVIVDDD